MKKILKPGAQRWMSMTFVMLLVLSNNALLAQIGKQVVTIQMNADNNLQLYRDGAPWIPHGVQMIAFAVAPAFLACKSDPNDPSCATVYKETGCGAPTPAPGKEPWFEAANQNYSEQEMQNILAWGADTVRMQLSQEAANPGTTQNPNSLYDATFVNQYVEAVQYARSIGLNVIVSIQDEFGACGQDPVPSTGTDQTWAKLAPMLNGDLGIMYELYNEPSVGNDSGAAADWKTYNTGITSSGSPLRSDSVGANKVVSTIRQSLVGGGPATATNILISDGLNEAQTLANLIPVQDSLTNKVVYSVHPYFHGYSDQSGTTWEARWEAATATVPVIVGEWGTLNTEPKIKDGFYCQTTATQKQPITTGMGTINLFTAMKQYKVGLVAVAFDEPRQEWGGIDTYSGSLPPTDFKGTPATTFVGTSCTSSNYGLGLTVQSWYEKQVVPTDPK